MTQPTHNPRRFQTFWYGGSLTPYERVCLRSFIDRGHQVDLYSYDPHLEAPAGVTVCDASDVLAENEVFVYEHEGHGKGSVSAFSNLFRYKLLRDRGGWWIDTDVVCLASQIADPGNQYFALEDDRWAAPGTMYFAAGSAAPAICMERAAAMGRNVRWGDGGPRVFTAVLEELGLIGSAAPTSDCYPIHYTEAVDMLRTARTKEFEQRLSTATFLHVWNSTLAHAGIDKFLLPPAGSLLRVIADRHPGEGWLGEYDEYHLHRDLSLRSEINHLRRENDELRSLQPALDATRRHLDDVLRSSSWRITRPLRSAAGALRSRGRPR